MINRVILGRITANTQELVDQAVKCCQADDIMGDIYFDTRNTSVESFLTNMQNTKQVLGSGYWEIENIKSFIEELESKMPIVVEGMDELDQMYAEQVLRFLPGALTLIKRDVLKDQELSRISRYYLKTVGSIVKGNLNIQLSVTTHPTTIVLLTRSVFFDNVKKEVIDLDKFVTDIEACLQIANDPTVMQELTDVYNLLKNSGSKYAKIAISYFD